MKYKLAKVDLKKVDEVEKNPELVEEVVLKWAYKYKDEPELSWDEAMTSAAQELGLNNRAELVTLIHGNKPFEDLSIGMLSIKNLKIIETEGKEIVRRVFGDKKVRRNASG